jgi:hypothetical protein
MWNNHSLNTTFIYVYWIHNEDVLSKNYKYLFTLACSLDILLILNTNSIIVTYYSFLSLFRNVRCSCCCPRSSKLCKVLLLTLFYYLHLILNKNFLLFFYLSYNLRRWPYVTVRRFIKKINSDWKREEMILVMIMTHVHPVINMRALVRHLETGEEIDVTWHTG